MRILAVFNVYNTNTEYLLDYICFFFFFQWLDFYTTLQTHVLGSLVQTWFMTSLLIIRDIYKTKFIDNLNKQIHQLP